MDTTLLYTKLASLPDHLQLEVADFIDFLALKADRSAEKKKPVFGSAKGMFVMSSDFDEPLDDFKEYMQ